ncbi:transposase [Vibrio sp. SM6]|uniref:Transposase n=1 Tax=Vibrio agarilyticus TaxID=2726741 RepID=A0A7X8TRI3_9VIBR|nr:transposase [Vibrio agarilyticus]
MIDKWLEFYNTERPHQALNMKTPAKAYVSKTMRSLNDALFNSKVVSYLGVKLA